MIHVFKAGSGTWQKDGVKYDCKCVSNADEYLAEGYSLTLDEAIAKLPKKAPAKKAKANDKKD